MLTPGESLPTEMKFMRAYFYPISQLRITREMVFEPRARMRPEALKSFIIDVNQDGA